MFRQEAQTNSYIDTFLKEIKVMWAVWIPYEKPHLFVMMSERKMPNFDCVMH